jgi:hypothetical protein
VPTIYRILVGCALITAVALISDRSRALAGILATAPINIPIILWILWGKAEGDYAGMQVTARSMLEGIASTACFIVVCWFGFARRWPLAPTLAAGYLVWAALIFGPALIRRLF